MKHTDLIEIKKGKVGNGLLIENDGYISLNENQNKLLKEDIDNHKDNGWYCPYPFRVQALFQKYDTLNANGRIYPKDILMREVEKYQQLIRERRALGECYPSDTLILTKNGWKELKKLVDGEEVLTLNTTTDQMEYQSIARIIKKEYNGKMIRIKGRNINDIVTPNHQFPLYDRYHKFDKVVSAQEIFNAYQENGGAFLSHHYIPKQGQWDVKGEDYYILKGLNSASIATKRIHPYVCEDVHIPMSTFMKFLGIYLAEGDFSKKGYAVRIHQCKENVCTMISELMEEMGLKYSIYQYKKKTVFTINDPRLHAFVKPLGDCYTKYIPKEFLLQSKENLRLLYDWFVVGDGRIRGVKGKTKLTDDVFSVSQQLVLDLNEIQLKIGYSGNYHVEPRDNDRYIYDRLIEGKNTEPLHFSLRSLVKGIYLSKYLSVTEEDFNGEVMCIEVPNHIWYCMCNNKCHWTHNCNHPSESTIDLSRVSHNITELHWEGKNLVGELELNLSQGFVQNGIVSTQGDMVGNLLLNGYKIGVSSRAVGSVENVNGQTIVQNDLEILCWDVVATPSTPMAYIVNDRNELESCMESKNNKKPLLSEKISKIKNLL